MQFNTLYDINELKENELSSTIIDTSPNTFLWDTSDLVGFTKLNEDYLLKCLYGWQILDEQNQRYWGIIIENKGDVIATKTDQIIDTGYAGYFSKIVLEDLLCFDFKPVIDEEEFEIEVVKKFKELIEVELIYVDSYMGNKRFKVFTSNSKYDDILMDRLLEIECELLSIHREEAMMFEYIPNIYQDISELVRDDSKLIYRRGYNVVFGSPSMASWKEREVSEAIIK